VDDPYGQAWRCIQLIEEALAAFDASLDAVVSTRVYLVNRQDWSAVAQAHAEVFEDIRPVNTMVVVQSLLDPVWRVEMEAEAILSETDQTTP